MTDLVDLTTLAGVEAHREEIEEFAAEGWATDQETGKVDWEEWADRLEARGYDLPGQWDDPAMKRIKQIARQAIRESIGG